MRRDIPPSVVAFTLLAPLVFLLGHLLWDLSQEGGFFRLMPGMGVYYMWNYQDFGFIKRGLVGTILRPGYTEESLRLAGMVAFFSGIVLSMALTFWYCAHEKRNLLRALFVFCPSLFLNYGYDFGRFDILLNALFLALLALLARRQFAACALIVVAGALIHEMFLVTHVPGALLAAWLIVPPGERQRALGGIGGAAGLAGLAILLFGKYEGDVWSILPLFDGLGTGDYYRTLMVLKRGIADNVVYNYAWIEHLGTANLMALFVPLAVFGPLLLFYHREVGAKRAVFLVALSPLALTILAADVGRWVSFSLFLMFVLPAFLKVHGARRAASGSPVTAKLAGRWVNVSAVATTAVLFLLGPPGVHIAWHLLRMVLEVFFGVYTLPGPE